MRVGNEGRLKGRADDAWQWTVITKWQIISCHIQAQWQIVPWLSSHVWYSHRRNLSNLGDWNNRGNWWQRGKLGGNTERTIITSEETRVTKLCSKLHTCLPRFETKHSKAHALVFYPVALFNRGDWIKQSGKINKSKCLQKLRE